MLGYAVIAHDAAITDKQRDTKMRLLTGNDARMAFLDYMVETIGEHRDVFAPELCQRQGSGRCHIRNEANLTSGENIGGTTAAPAAPEAGSDDDDGGGDPDPEPERQTRTRKPRNTSPAGNLPAPRAAQSTDALNQFDTRPAASFVRLPVVCSLYACSPATAWRWVKAGKIPAPIKLSDRVTAWRVGDLRAALAQLAA